MRKLKLMMGWLLVAGVGCRLGGQTAATPGGVAPPVANRGAGGESKVEAGDEAGDEAPQPRFVVPDLAGLSYVEGWDRLRAAGHRGPVQFTGPDSHLDQLGIYSVSDVGQSIEARETVLVRVGWGPDSKVQIMPRLIGLTVREAIAAMLAAHMYAFNIQVPSEHSRGCRADVVCLQDPDPGTDYNSSLPPSFTAGR